MDTDSLRAGTRAQHEAVEALLPLMAAELTPGQYTAALRCMYRALKPWEEWASLHAPPSLAALVAGRRRTPLIEADFRHWNEDLPASDGPEGLDRLFAAVFGDGKAFEAAFLGAMYVVEGSTLGGQRIARHVEAQFGLEPGAGDAYFRGYGEQTGARWREFKDLLVAVPDQYADAVIEAARAMFGFFGEALQPCAAVPAGKRPGHDR